MIATNDTAAWVGAAGSIVAGAAAAIAAFYAYRSARESAKVGEHAVLVARLDRYQQVLSILGGLRTAGGNAWPHGLVDLRMALRPSDPLPICQGIADPTTSGGRSEMLEAAITEVGAAIARTEEELRG